MYVHQSHDDTMLTRRSFADELSVASEKRLYILSFLSLVTYTDCRLSFVPNFSQNEDEFFKRVLHYIPGVGTDMLPLGDSVSGRSTCELFDERSPCFRYFLNAIHRYFKVRRTLVGWKWLRCNWKLGDRVSLFGM